MSKIVSRSINRPIYLGISGSNTSIYNRDGLCAAGTLGALIKDTSGVRYILSNAHVLSPDGARAVDTIVQPADLDNGCVSNPSNFVARLSKWVKLGGTTPPGETDVAIARASPNKVRSDGAIYRVGVINSSLRDPKNGMNVMKSGRTTGLTRGKIIATGASVYVEYDNYTILFSGVFIVHGNFSQAGDSGSLILSDSKYPVGLLFAGSGQYTIGFPIKRVMNRVKGLLGKSVSFVGRTTRDIISDEPLDDNSDVVDRTIGILDKGIVGAGIGVGGDLLFVIGGDRSIVDKGIIHLDGPFKAL